MRLNFIVIAQMQVLDNEMPFSFLQVVQNSK